MSVDFCFSGNFFVVQLQLCFDGGDRNFFEQIALGEDVFVVGNGGIAQLRVAPFGDVFGKFCSGFGIVVPAQRSSAVGLREIEKRPSEFGFEENFRFRRRREGKRFPQRADAGEGGIFSGDFGERGGAHFCGERVFSPGAGIGGECGDSV